jgi:hypothetical protein
LLFILISFWLVVCCSDWLLFILLRSPQFTPLKLFELTRDLKVRLPMKSAVVL